MKYITSYKQDNRDYVGIVLCMVYLFFTFLANGNIFPTVLNRITMYIFLLYGILVFAYRFFRQSLIISRYSYWYALFIVFTSITILYSDYKTELFSDSYYQLIVCFMITFFLAEFIVAEEDFILISWTYVVSSLFMIAFLYMTGGLVGTASERLGQDILGNSNTFATFIMYSEMYALWLFIFTTKNKMQQVVLGISILAGMYALMLSAGRKYFIIPVLFIYALLILKKDERGKRYFIKNTVFVAVIIIVLYLLITKIPILHNSIGIRLEQFINQYTGRGEVDASSKIRKIMREVAIEGWRKKPILGHGYNTFQYYRSKRLFNGGIHGYSHCNFTELLFSGGIVYCLIYYLGYAICVFNNNFKKIDTKFFAFTIAAAISQFVFDYGGVTYELITTQVFLMMALRGLEIGYGSNTCKSQIIEDGFRYLK